MANLLGVRLPENLLGPATEALVVAEILSQEGTLALLPERIEVQ